MAAQDKTPGARDRQDGQRLAAGTLAALRAALIAGEKSGMSAETPDTIRARVLARHAKVASAEGEGC
jgi:hypothetical protein